MKLGRGVGCGPPPVWVPEIIEWMNWYKYFIKLSEYSSSKAAVETVHDNIKSKQILNWTVIGPLNNS